MNLTLRLTALMGMFMMTVAGLHAAQPDDHLVFEGKEGPGKGKHVVFLAGDEEYRSEEAMPMLAEILSRQGFKCTVLFSMTDGKVDPNNQKNLSHPQALDSADAMVLSLRFRGWEDKAMEHFDKAFKRGIPVIGLRTSTHAFKIGGKWAKYSFNAKADTGWHKGFGRQVLGETWINHHGGHKREGCRTHVEEANKNHAVLNGVGQIFCTSDVYGVKPLEPSTILLRGAVTETLEPDSKDVEGKKNNPMMPVVWVREYKHEDGKKTKVFTSTMGASSDLTDENLRRVILNGVYWGLGLEVPKKLDVSLTEGWTPTFYSFNKFKKGLTPADFVPTSKAMTGGSAEAEKKKQ